MIKTWMTTLALTTFAALPVLGAASSANAQIRVDSRLFTSSGSCANCDFSGRSMTGMTLRDSNFAGSQFNNANLSGGSFDRSNLSGTQFHRAFLARVEGASVNLTEASLRDATLSEASLNESVMIRADLRRADLTRATFTKTDFTDADLTSANGVDVDFRESNFRNARFDHMNLNRAKLDAAHFQGVQFGNALFAEATMAGADFSDADLSMAQGLSQAQLDTACGNANTQLPTPLSLPYCESAVMNAHHGGSHDGLSPAMKRAAVRLDTAINGVETLLSSTPPSELATRRSLERIHADLVSSRRAIQAQ